MSGEILWGNIITALIAIAFFTLIVALVQWMARWKTRIDHDANVSHLIELVEIGSKHGAPVYKSHLRQAMDIGHIAFEAALSAAAHQGRISISPSGYGVILSPILNPGEMATSGSKQASGQT